jgi:hypothetical protein
VFYGLKRGEVKSTTAVPSPLSIFYLRLAPFGLGFVVLYLFYSFSRAVSALVQSYSKITQTREKVIFDVPSLEELAKYLEQWAIFLGLILAYFSLIAGRREREGKNKKRLGIGKKLPQILAFLIAIREGETFLFLRHNAAAK